MPKKPATKAERDWMSRVANLGCIVCSECLSINDSPAEIHHLTGIAGLGKKASNREIIPLCAPHHRIGGNGVAFHATVKRVWEDMFKPQIELLELTKELLNGSRL